MISRTTSVATFMTAAPHSIQPHETLAAARRRMGEHKVRHLPVQSGGTVVGVISERDLFVIQGIGDVDFAEAKVGFAMTPDPFVVLPTAAVADVARKMWEHRIGSALVVDETGNLVGIFTDTDALGALANVLGQLPAGWVVQ